MVEEETPQNSDPAAPDQETEAFTGPLGVWPWPIVNRLMETRQAEETASLGDASDAASRGMGRGRFTGHATGRYGQHVY